MLLRWALGVVLVLILLSGKGCTPKNKTAVDEDKNPYLLAGRDWMAQGNAVKARRNFEQALAVNPQSPLAHYELGLLDERFDRDYVSAIYHYRQATKLRSTGYPADNAKYRIEACMQELVKAELIAPVAQNMVRELDRLKKENAQLKEQLESIRTTPTHPTQAVNRTTDNKTETAAKGTRNTTAETSKKSEGTTNTRGATPTGSGQVHAVKRGETVYGICRQYRISQDKLLQANPGLNPRSLEVGQQLRIPN